MPMGILAEDIARVREATDAAAVIGEQVALRRVGGRLVGLCPFHTEKTPSFSVNAAEGLYYCFGCQARGDVITFVRETQQLDFAGAVELLAGKVGIQLRYDSSSATHEHQRRSELGEAMDAAVEWYHARLLNGADAGPARRYLRRERGYDTDVVRSFKLGWAPDGWDELTRAVKFPPQVMRDAGLSLQTRNGRQIDAFRGRLIFPIFDAGGRAVGLGGRILPGAEGPKYKNSQEGPLYSKRRVLYGLNWAKADIVANGEVIVCEGYTDVISFHRAGLPRAVATCGTALADEHMALLKNFARRIVLAYDDDAAGQGAAERFYGWEQKLELDIHVLRLPQGEDPGSTPPDVLRTAVADARPFLQFWVDRIIAASDMSTVEGRTRAAEKALVAVASHPNALIRDQYVMQLADQCRVPAGRLRERLAQPASERASERASDRRGAPDGHGAPEGHLASERTRAARADRPVVTPAHGVETEALRLAVHRPEDMAPYLEPVLFEDPVHLDALQSLLTAPTLREAIEMSGPEAQALLARLAVEEPDEALDSDDIVGILVRAAAIRQVVRLESEARASGEAVTILTWLKPRIEALTDPERRLDVSTELVGWLFGVQEEG